MRALDAPTDAADVRRDFEQLAEAVEVFDPLPPEISSDDRHDLLGGRQAARGQQRDAPIARGFELVQLAIRADIVDAGVGTRIGSESDAVVHMNRQAVGHGSASLPEPGARDKTGRVPSIGFAAAVQGRTFSHPRRIWTWREVGGMLRPISAHPMSRTVSLLPPSLWLASITSGALVLPLSAHAAPEAGVEASADTDEGAKVTTKDPSRKERERAEAAKENEKPWIRRWAPENNELDVGMYLGVFFIGRNHSLFNPSFVGQPRLHPAAFDLGFRATYFPLRFVGAGIEGGFAPTRSPQLAERATVGSFRVHVVGQLPYRVTPTLVIGGGLLHMTSPSPRLRAVDGAFHWGAGVKFHINKWIAIRLDGRHMVAPNGANGRAANHGELTVGIDVTLRFKRILNSDRDGDGVPDRRDACPDVPGDGDDGCPTDRDRDGVRNERDECPDTWGDQPNGCPSADADGDG